MSGKIDTKSMTEGAILAALAVIIGLSGYYVPLFSVLMILWALPMIICTYRNGLQIGIIMTMIASLLFGMLADPLTGISMALGMGLPGVAMGHLLSEGKSVGSTILTGAVLMVIGMALFAVSSVLIAGKDLAFLFDEIQKFIKLYFDTMAKTMQQVGGANTEFAERLEQMPKMMFNLLPALLLMTAAICIFVNFKLSVVILRRMGSEIQDFPPFSLWIPPQNFSAGVLVSMLMILIATFLNVPGIGAAMDNLFILFQFAFSIIGLSVFSFYLQRLGMKNGIRYVILIIAYLAAQVIFFYIGLGELVFHFRQRSINKTGGI